MSEFNKKGRTYNAARSSMTGVACHIANLLVSVIYRMLFVRILSVNYLGLNGLFTNILQVLSLSDLGVVSAITYRFYKPISTNDTEKVGQLMRFFKRIYLTVAMVIMVLGLVLMPFLKSFIKDMSEVPADVNIYVVYLLFLVHSASTYLYSYKLTILTADQRQYTLTLFNTAVNMLKNILQLAVLFLTHNFVVALAISIVTTLLSNIVFSAIVSKQYASVFSVKTDLPKSEKRGIFSDMRATLCHRIGGTALNSTDSIVISSFLGITATGIYSNYSLILGNLRSLVYQMLGTFVGSIGNANAQMDADGKCEVFKRLMFVNLWVASACTACIYMLVNDFICMWLGPDCTLSVTTVIALAIQFFMEGSRCVPFSFTEACGLIMKDRIRPLIETALNIIISVALVRRIGITGVFIGTIVSVGLTAFWRTPYLLFKHVFHRSSAEFWLTLLSFALVTTASCGLMTFIKARIGFGVGSFFVWMAEAVVVFILINLILLPIYCRTPEFRYYKTLLLRKLKRHS